LNIKLSEEESAFLRYLILMVCYSKDKEED
jgi:hypothetical protein